MFLPGSGLGVAAAGRPLQQRPVSWEESAWQSQSSQGVRGTGRGGAQKAELEAGETPAGSGGPWGAGRSGSVKLGALARLQGRGASAPSRPQAQALWLWPESPPRPLGHCCSSLAFDSLGVSCEPAPVWGWGAAPGAWATAALDPVPCPLPPSAPGWLAGSLVRCRGGVGVRGTVLGSRGWGPGG